MLETNADLAIVVGGYNSSNTSHLVELCAEKYPTYFINGADKIISGTEIETCDWQTKETFVQQNYLPGGLPVKILLTSGASCPDAIVEEVIKKILSVCGSEEKFAEIEERFA